MDIQNSFHISCLGFSHIKLVIFLKHVQQDLISSYILFLDNFENGRFDFLHFDILPFILQILSGTHANIVEAIGKVAEALNFKDFIFVNDFYRRSYNKSQSNYDIL